MGQGKEAGEGTHRLLWGPVAGVEREASLMKSASYSSPPSLSPPSSDDPASWLLMPASSSISARALSLYQQIMITLTMAQKRCELPMHRKVTHAYHSHEMESEHC